MGGGLMQLVAYGAQDIYITGNPQITFFKVIYRRHTNFAIETVEQQFVGNIGFGNTLSAKISRNGDLMTKVYLRVILNGVDPTATNSNFAWVRRVGHAMINQIEIDIGGTKIDRQYGTWLDIWYELARAGDHEKAYARMIGDVPELTTYDTSIKEAYTLYVPLQFWFNRFVGLAIPLIALQYHDTIINVTFANVNQLVIYDCKFDLTLVTMQNASLLVNYVYLDTDERRRFALVGHEYLIEQIQFNGVEPTLADQQKYILDFNHPTKELIWALRNGNYSTGQEFVFYSNQDEWPIDEAACSIVNQSISIGVNPNMPGVTWYEVLPGTVATIGTFNVTNNMTTKSAFVNPTSLSIGDYGITSQINVDVNITVNGVIECNNIVTTLTVRDLSFPVSSMTDTRYNVCDPFVNIFSNYGLLIDGTGNPVQYGLLQFNGHNRFDRREGLYFNYVQPNQHHENTPRDGINCYSFALYPEQHQPSGTSNLSRIESSTLTIWFSDSTFSAGLPLLPFINPANQLFIFVTNYNILRVYSGLAGIAYSV